MAYQDAWSEWSTSEGEKVVSYRSPGSQRDLKFIWRVFLEYELGPDLWWLFDGSMMGTVVMTVVNEGSEMSLNDSAEIHLLNRVESD